MGPVAAALPNAPARVGLRFAQVIASFARVQRWQSCPVRAKRCTHLHGWQPTLHCNGVNDANGVNDQRNGVNDQRNGDNQW